mmetsp:Transcript_18919/g.44456  ORF Transcript_18919/g.44456 Transcript_18919/m.44456 type:complete len:202 (-) Transcript_18919:293-898(-)
MPETLASPLAFIRHSLGSAMPQFEASWRTSARYCCSKSSRSPSTPAATFDNLSWSSQALWPSGLAAARLHAVNSSPRASLVALRCSCSTLSASVAWLTPAVYTSSSMRDRIAADEVLKQAICSVADFVRRHPPLSQAAASTAACTRNLASSVLALIASVGLDLPQPHKKLVWSSHVALVLSLLAPMHPFTESATARVMARF